MSLLAISTALSAQKPVELELWPDGVPNSNGITTPEQKLENNRISNVSEPTLTVYPAAKPNGLAVVACPGGGYIRLAMNHEGRDMADWFNAQGITYAVLKYRMPNGHHDVPLSDAHQAIRLMREHANEWHIQKVGIMGASAGGHLASTAATHYTAGTRPDQFGGCDGDGKTVFADYCVHHYNIIGDFLYFASHNEHSGKNLYTGWGGIFDLWGISDRSNSSGYRCG